MLRLAASLALALLCFGCGSDVDLCGGGAVCGIDGVSYADRCAAASARVEIAYLGACAFECAPVDCALACERGFLRGPDGCPTCACAECEVRDDCVGDARCVEGRCVQEGDAGVDPTDGGVVVGPEDGGVFFPDGGVCPDERELCGETCVSLSVDTNHCGECFETCALETSGPGRAACVEGDCVAVACPAGTADCDEDGRNGCEVDIRTDEEQCGACGNSCGTGELCIAGACVAESEACRDPGNWIVEEDTALICNAKCGEYSAELRPIGGSCGLTGAVCGALTVALDCAEQAVRCCLPRE